MSKKIISFVVPCYNEEGNVEDFYKTIEIQFLNNQYNYEIVFVNDGSKDNTMDKLREIYNSHKKNVKVINFLKNFGKEAALLAGIKEATGDYICTIDADLQQDPIYAIQMTGILEKNENIDMVAAKPNNIKDSTTLSFFKKSFYFIINKLSDTQFRQGVSDFRVFRKSIKNVILQMKEHNRFSKGLFSWICPDIECIEYEVEPRNSGQTKWSFVKLMKYAINGICSFSHAPLFFPIGVGIAELVTCAFFFIAQIIALIFGLEMNYQLRWLIMLILFLTGTQSLSTGIIAKYISHIHTETLNRPIYIVKETLKGDSDLW